MRASQEFIEHFSIQDFFMEIEDDIIYDIKKSCKNNKYVTCNIIDDIVSKYTNMYINNFSKKT